MNIDNNNHISDDSYHNHISNDSCHDNYSDNMTDNNCNCGFCVNVDVSDNQMLAYFLTKNKTTKSKFREYIYKSMCADVRNKIMGLFYSSHGFIMDRNLSINEQYMLFIKWNPTCVHVTIDQLDDYYNNHIRNNNM